VISNRTLRRRKSTNGIARLGIMRREAIDRLNAIIDPRPWNCAAF